MKYKLLKGAAHNYGHSFVGGMNWDKHGTPIVDLIGNRVLETGNTIFEVNLLSGAVKPESMAPKPIKKSIQRYVKYFPTFLRSHKVTIEAIRKASIKVEFFPKRLLSQKGSHYVELPYQCTVEFKDDKGKFHFGKVKEQISFIASPHPLIKWLKSAFKRKR